MANFAATPPPIPSIIKTGVAKPPPIPGAIKTGVAKPPPIPGAIKPTAVKATVAKPAAAKIAAKTFNPGEWKNFFKQYWKNKKGIPEYHYRKIQPGTSIGLRTADDVIQLKQNGRKY